jgi:branched-chain amino acid transport system ATP-binding protein
MNVNAHPSSRSAAAAALTVKHLSAGYGELRVLHDISFHAAAAKLTVLVGANGAGKSTLLKSIAGVLPMQSGEVTFDGRSVASHGVAGRVRSGLSLVPEGRHLFVGMSVQENLELGGCLMSRAQRAESMQWVLQRLPKLGERLTQMAGTMSGGEQQMVAIGRALMARPRVLMLDEPSLGLAPLAFRAMMDLLAELCTHGITVLLVEQNVRQALSRADYGYVLERGRVVGEGAGRELLASDLIQRTYLGK